MVVGGWWLVVGSWLLVVVVVGCWLLLVVGCWYETIGREGTMPVRKWFLFGTFWERHVYRQGAVAWVS